MTRRLNARIDDELAAKLEHLQRRTGKNTTEIIRESIERYYAQESGSRESTRELLEAAGFIACAEAGADLSTTYKDILPETLANKTGQL